MPMAFTRSSSPRFLVPKRKVHGQLQRQMEAPETLSYQVREGKRLEDLNFALSSTEPASIYAGKTRVAGYVEHRLYCQLSQIWNTASRCLGNRSVVRSSLKNLHPCLQNSFNGFAQRLQLLLFYSRSLIVRVSVLSSKIFFCDQGFIKAILLIRCSYI